ncbi:DUF2934 domain-containing protein [Paracoccus aerius]|uniref:DUF2934 domain-containing protein n=1 Tax=Paracoccus aerius TaxID=1915382 RepID=A0ABS1SAE4_9RHOB|nr:DUF2934 domain-containing protein [Paracoccus aerius]MBL3675711.1 DUF2934 domain-containing protein [Paracoccus aerius]GHG36380.1 hypothetical protein GCM10017322_39070 [Paracoccus aerius]
MEERLVDVIDSKGRVLHTYPITLGEADRVASDADYKAKALQAAAHGMLVPHAELPGLTTRMHQSRGGRLQPYSDEISTTSETKLGLEQAVRDQAYALWEQEGRPDGRAEEFWHRALEQHLKGRAYVLWQQEGSPDGGADKDWHQTREFQSQ